MKFQEYVCGFMFQEDQVLLIQKDRPEWQRGKLNGVGGKIENYEDIYQAMCREFKEEVGIHTNERDWKHVLDFECPDCRVHFLKSYGEIYTNRQMETERPRIINIRDLYNRNIISNLLWVIPLCLDKNIRSPIAINYKI